MSFDKESEYELLYEFFNFSPAIINTLKDIPSVSRNKFIENTKPADLIVVYGSKSSFKNTLSYIRSRILGLAQGGLFTSIKIIIDQRKIIGYGIGNGLKKDSKINVDTRSLPEFMKNVGGAVLIRVPDLNNDQRQGIIQYMIDRIGLSYNSSQLFTSSFQRIKDLFYSTNDQYNVTEDDIDSAVNQVKEPLICSNIIAIAIKSVGKKLNLYHDSKIVWPRDFLLSPDTIKICKYVKED